MDILLFNLSWMIYNSGLAFIPVVVGPWFLSTKNLFLKIFLFGIWLLFLPNTIYLLTDFKWFFEQFPKLELPFQMVLVIQYIVLVTLGIITFLLGLRPLCGKNLAIFLLNYLIALGVALGRFERINSWDVLTQPLVVLESILSLQEYLLFIFLFGTLGNIIYFGYKKIFGKL